jgi:putative membrane protein
MMGYGMMGGDIFCLLFIGLLVYLIVSLFNNSKGIQSINHNKDPYETLKIRYAKGEINEEEYQRMKNILND